MSTVELTAKLSDLQLTTVYLDQVRLKKREDVVLPQGASVKWKLAQRVGFLLNTPHELRIKIDGRVEFEEGSLQPFDLELSIVGIYQSKEPIDNSKARDYISTYSTPLLWPYIREAISDLTTRMGGPTFVLPTLYIQVAAKQAEGTESVRGSAPATIPADEKTVEGDLKPSPKRGKRRSKAD